MSHPEEDDRTLSFINADAGYAVFGEDIIVPAEQGIIEGVDTYIIGPCPHLNDHEFHVEVEDYLHPTVH